MARDAASGKLPELAGLVHTIAGDVERLVAQRAALAREEPRDGLGRAPAAVAALGAGAGLVAAGGVSHRERWSTR
jgi:hypothetical protein